MVSLSALVCPQDTMSVYRVQDIVTQKSLSGYALILLYGTYGQGESPYPGWKNVP